MKEEPNNKCKELGFAHAWKDITPNIVYATNPPQYPPRQEQCCNCGLMRTHLQKVEKWFDYELREIPQESFTEIYIGDDLTATNGDTYTFTNNQHDNQ